MDSVSNVRSLAAKFNTAPSPMEDSDTSQVHPALKGIQARKAGFEKNSSPVPGFTPKKPVPTKPTYGLKPVTDETKPPIARPGVGVSRAGGSFHVNNDTNAKVSFPKPPGFKPPDLHKEEPKPLFPKAIGNKSFTGASTPQENRFGIKKSSFEAEHKENEEKPAFPRPSALKGFNTATETESKPVFPKKPQLGGKPSGNVVGTPTESPVVRKNIVTKTYSSSQDTKPPRQPTEPAESNDGPSSESITFSQLKLRSTGIKPIQSPFLKHAEEEHNHGSPRPSFPSKDFQNKTAQDPKSPRPQFPSLVSNVQDKLKDKADPSEPRRKPLTPSFKLGPPPQKPFRPPKVDLQRFKDKKRNGGSKRMVPEQKTSALSTALPPPPPLAQGGPSPANSSPAKHAPAPALPPSLPPRNLRPLPDAGTQSDEENYDYVEDNGGLYPDDMSLESDDDYYDGVDPNSPQHRKEQEAKKDKEEKRRLEQAKKEQKEKEKKEQDMRKRFKLTGSIEVLHQARACSDSKGGKNELSFKLGDQLEIIRVTDNPEGKWLGRMKGCYGYIKTTMVNIDYDSLRRKKSTMTVPVKPQDYDQEIYDDVGEDDSVSSHSASGSSGTSFFPPPPNNDEIYDGVDEGNEGSVPQDEDKGSGRPWGIFKMLKGVDLKKKSVYAKSAKEDSEENEFALIHSPPHDGDVYDDVDSCDFPPPPVDFSLSITKSGTLGKPVEKDYKTLKKMEKEEKEFRKKFKYTGEIRALTTVLVVAGLTTKKWGSKDLPLKSGESIDVIQHTNETTLLCRNYEGKYGYVSRSNIIDDDGEIYDDIGEECIYDND
uniref:FYN-binding protein 1 n=1 Tax=Leptobrachium leishanense TaxID=445787 RepID=A0A8C5LPV1_9ANUR